MWQQIQNQKYHIYMGISTVWSQHPFIDSCMYMFWWIRSSCRPDLLILEPCICLYLNFVFVFVFVCSDWKQRMIMVGTNEREGPGLPESLIGLALSELMIAHHRINLVFAFVFVFVFSFALSKLMIAHHRINLVFAFVFACICICIFICCLKTQDRPS